MKDCYYFPHDSNAKDDPKCAALIREQGMFGYGFYWLIIETLHEQREGKLEKFPKLMEGLAQKFQCTPEQCLKQIEALLHDYKLLQEDEKYIFSERVTRNLEERQRKKMAKVESGRIGGLNSGISRSKSKQCFKDAEANEPKERKGKEIKEKNIYNESVLLTAEEYQKLKDMFGSEADDKIQNLNNYILSSGRKYKSHYHTILVWEKKNKESRPKPELTTSQKRTIIA